MHEFSVSIASDVCIVHDIYIYPLVLKQKQNWFYQILSICSMLCYILNLWTFQYSHIW